MDKGSSQGDVPFGHSIIVSDNFWSTGPAPVRRLHSRQAVVVEFADGDPPRQIGAAALVSRTPRCQGKVMDGLPDSSVPLMFNQRGAAANSNGNDRGMK